MLDATGISFFSISLRMEGGRAYGGPASHTFTFPDLKCPRPQGYPHLGEC